MSEPQVIPLNRPPLGQLVISNVPTRKGIYLCLSYGGDVYPVARFTNEAGLDRFRRWVAGNKGKTMGGLRVER